MILSKKRLCFSSCNFAFIYLFALIRFTSEELNLHKEFSGKHFKRFTNEKESFICKENNKFSGVSCFTHRRCKECTKTIIWGLAYISCL